MPFLKAIIETTNDIIEIRIAKNGHKENCSLHR